MGNELEIIERREFLKRALVAGTATVAPMLVAPRSARADKPKKSANEKLDLGIIGVADRGAANLGGVAGENIVALCDIDYIRLAGAAQRFPNATTYNDCRKLVEREKLDAVVISTPDHMHALPAVMALQAGMDVYCEKPLAHSVWEVRQMRRWTKRRNAVTQMGTQIHAENNYRRVVEIVQAGAIGQIKRVHVWQSNFVRVPGVRVQESTPPSHIEYDLWLGPAPFRPYHESHFHFNWRYWFDFGGGILADMACHYMDLPFWALKLRDPLTIQAKGEKTSRGENDVPDHMQVDYEFPARGDLPPVHLTWYHGAWQPPGAEVYGKGSAVLFEGERGRLLADYGTRKLFLEPGLEEPKIAPTIPNSIGHHREWIEAVKSRGTTTCNFDYSGALAEAVLLGNVSYRCGGKKLEWDARRLRARNAREVRQFIRREYRKGWELEEAP